MGILNLRKNADEWRDITEGRLRTLSNELLHKANTSIEGHISTLEKRFRAVAADLLDDAERRLTRQLNDVEQRVNKLELKATVTKKE